MREVSENLKDKELTLEDFTFFKEPLGIDDPEKEIIRDAKLKSGSGTPQFRKAAAASTPKEKKTPARATNSPKHPTASPVAGRSRSTVAGRSKSTVAGRSGSNDSTKEKPTPKPGGYRVSLIQYYSFTHRCVKSQMK